MAGANWRRARMLKACLRHDRGPSSLRSLGGGVRHSGSDTMVRLQVGIRPGGSDTSMDDTISPLMGYSGSGPAADKRRRTSNCKGDCVMAGPEVIETGYA